MNLEFTQEELAFRDQVRAFIREKFPDDIRSKVDRGQTLTKEDHVRWQKILHEQGWAAPSWPVEWGGCDWTQTQKHIFAGELGAAGCPPVIAFGIKMVAPVIYTYGNEEQKKRFLPDILASNVWWCQGYSEPGAGSDLASLTTRAVRDGDHYVVNGVKAWTTQAQYADWIFCLVRTDPDVKKQRGISFLLIDMKTPGVSVHPVITMEGGHEVNETHFENVRVPAENLIGEENSGWTYAKYLLTHERTSNSIGSLRRSLSLVRQAAKKTKLGGSTLADDPDFSRRAAELEIDIQALEFLTLRILSTVEAGGSPGAKSSIIKLRGTEIGQAINRLMLTAAGYGAMAYYPKIEPGPGELTTHAAGVYFNNRKTTIYAGSSEVQRGIISKAELGL